MKLLRQQHLFFSRLLINGRSSRVSTGSRESEGSPLANAELCFQLDHAVGFLAFEIAQKALAPAHHVGKAAAGMIVFFIGLEMPFQMLDSATQNRYLYVRRTGVLVVRTKFLNRL